MYLSSKTLVSGRKLNWNDLQWHYATVFCTQANVLFMNPFRMLNVLKDYKISNFFWHSYVAETLGRERKVSLAIFLRLYYAKQFVS